MVILPQPPLKSSFCQLLYIYATTLSPQSHLSCSPSPAVTEGLLTSSRAPFAHSPSFQLVAATLASYKEVEVNRCLVTSGRKHRHDPLVFLIEIRKFNFPDFPLTFYRHISSTFGSLKWTNQATWALLRHEKWQVLKGKTNLSHCD